MTQKGPSVSRLKAALLAESSRLRMPKMLKSCKVQTTPVGPPLWVSALVYVLLSVLMTWPLVTQLGTHFPSPDTDIFNGYWGNWWFRHALGSGQNPYVTDYLLYPVGFDVIAFGFSPVLALLWLPLSWILPDLLAFNLVLLLTVVLTCLSTDQLVRYLTGNGWAGLVAGITFGFAPSLVAERLPHPSKATLFWIPWALLVLTRLVREARIRDAFLLAALIGLAFLTLPQVGIFVVMSCAVYFVDLLVMERRRWHRLAVPRLLLAGLLSLLLLIPVLAYAWQSLMQPGGSYLLEWGAEITQTDLLAYVVPPDQHPLLGALQAVVDGQRYVLGERYWVYLGILPILLVLYAAISRPRAALPWLLLGSIFLILALGPCLRLGGEVYPAIKLPYSLAMGLFSAAGLNTPNRFNMVVAAAVSVLVGLACAQLYSRFRRPWPLLLAGLLIAGEFLLVPLPTILPPPASAFYQQMADDGDDYAIVDLPLTRTDGEAHRYYQTIHHKPIVGGWIKRVPASAFGFVNNSPLLAPWISNDQTAVWSLDSALAHLSQDNVRYLVLHKDQLSGVPESMRILLGAVEPVYQDAHIMVLPTEIEPEQEYNVAHWFGDGVGLIGPTAFLQVPDSGGTPMLSASVCWLGDGEVDAADRYQITLAGPDGVAVRGDMVYLPNTTQRLNCDSYPFHLEPSSRTGEYTLEVTAFSGEQVLGTYSSTQDLLRLPSPAGEAFPVMGSPCYVPFDADIELLGYNIMDGESFVWIDLFWRSTTSVQQRTYSRAVSFLDPATEQIIAGAEGQIQNHEWEVGELFQERIVLWLDKDLPDDAVLSVELDGQRVTGGCRADLLVEEYTDSIPPGVQVYVSPVSPEDSGAISTLPVRPALKGYDGRACLVMPRQTLADTAYIVAPGQDPDSLNLLFSYFLAGQVVAEGPLQNGQPLIVVFEVPAGSAAEIAPSHRTGADWDNKIRLLGYDIDAASYAPGDSVRLTLYYETLEEMDADYTLFAHLVTSEDSVSSKPIWGQNDSEPCQRSYRTSEWMPGEIVRDEIVVSIAGDTPPGSYQLEVGFYLLETMTRLPATDAMDVPLAEDAVPLGSFGVDSID